MKGLKVTSHHTIFMSYVKYQVAPGKAGFFGWENTRENAAARGTGSSPSSKSFPVTSSALLKIWQVLGCPSSYPRD